MSKIFVFLMLGLSIGTSAAAVSYGIEQETTIQELKKQVLQNSRSIEDLASAQKTTTDTINTITSTEDHINNSIHSITVVLEKLMRR